MGLASALSTALTGMGASQSTIDVVGNNLSNSSTVGFKASTAIFATQFLQTQSLGSGPQGDSGGTNPQQIGLGTAVAEITPDFTQGTIQVSSSPSDLAIQGQGFFIVQGNSGETLYTRDGQFQTNSQNDLVTPTGAKLLGYGVDGNYQVKATTLQPVSIPLGTTAVAQATKNVQFEGTLPPTGDVANTAEIIQSAVLGDSRFSAPPAGTTANIAVPPIVTSTTAAASGAPGPLIPGGTYDYKVVYVDANGNESDAASFSGTIPASAASSEGMTISNLPTDSSGKYVGRRVYRTQELATAGANPVYYLDKNYSSDNTTTTFTDTTDDTTLATQAQQDTSTISGNYSYYVTFVKPGEPESHPSPLAGPQNVTGDRIVVSNLPTPTGQYAGGQIRIYRNLATNPSVFYRVADVNAGTSFVDHVSDATISNSSTAGFEQLDFNGPRITPDTPLVDVQSFDGTTYNVPFQTGKLAFTGEKGGRTLTAKDLTITNTTTVQDLVDFVSQATGIQPPSADSAHPVPGDISGASQGGSVLANGRIQFVSNNGVDNAVTIPLSSFVLTPTAGGGNTTPNLTFSETQAAKGQTAVSDFVAYDSLGIPVNVRVTADLESQNSTSTVYRWFADSPDNQPVNGVGTAVGTGLITFDGNGKVVSVSNSTVSINRSQTPSQSLQFNLNFNQLSGLSASTATLTTSGQDGSGAGTLSSFNINGDGTISGVFTNGVTRTLGQIQLARFTNPDGLEQRGQNNFAAGVNSGLPIQGSPGTQGIGSIVSGALEQSNTDVGTNLIDLILASTQYQGNTRVVSTVNTLFGDLLNLGRG
ncbi:MAG TPA: flagellar hook-basal body complex protein [Pirellulales bacterium]|nr:flagellar hook-basal body complex protein [Pirellulales bacterium]